MKDELLKTMQIVSSDVYSKYMLKAFPTAKGGYISIYLTRDGEFIGAYETNAKGHVVQYFIPKTEPMYCVCSKDKHNGYIIRGDIAYSKEQAESIIRANAAVPQSPCLWWVEPITQG